jgi:hypothetical protein
MAGAQWERAMGFWSELAQNQMAQARDFMSEAAQAATAGTAAATRQVQHASQAAKSERKVA